LLAIFTKVSMAVVVCARASAFTSATSFGLPPRVAALAFLKGLEIAVVHCLLAVLRAKAAAKLPRRR